MSIDYYEEAIGQFQQALGINPRFIEAHNAWGIALARSGKTGEAIDHFRKALWLKPNYAPARNNLETALEVQKKSR
jgi:tetratricopeptide (TPR) repeat protein